MRTTQIVAIIAMLALVVGVGMAVVLANNHAV
jgi:hypothetical protein